MTTGTKLIGTNSTPFQYFKTWSGEDDPEFHQRENAYQMSLEVRQSGGVVRDCGTGCTSCIDKPDVQLTARNLQGWLPDEVQDLFRLAKYKAQRRLVDPIRGHDLDLGNYIPEGRQTAALVGSALDRSYKAVQALQRGDVGMAVRAMAGGGNSKNSRYTRDAMKMKTTDISSAHLAMVYGVMPLLSDIFESAKAWEAVTAPARTWIVRSSGSAKADTSHLTTGPYYDWKSSCKVRVEYKVYMREQLSVPRSLGLYDPLGMLWEGTKLSFVLDWFIPIGNYFDTLNVLPWIEADIFSSTKFTQRSNLVSEARYPWGCSPWGAGYDLSSYKSHVKHVFLQRGRDAFTHASIATPSFKPMKHALSTGHLQNAAALIHQMLPKLWK